jgi:lambda repressor-like predicted transcriptional regulator
VNRDRIEAAIEKAGWNIALAARLLGISRDTLRYRLRKYGLTARIQAAVLSRGVEGAPGAHLQHPPTRTGPD